MSLNFANDSLFTTCKSFKECLRNVLHMSHDIVPIILDTF